MEAMDITRLEEAVVAFYRSTSQEQAITHEWLTKAQVSPQAWQFSWQLMQLGKSQEVQFFGAVTLHSKLMKYWHEVPVEHREELKRKILETIIQFAAGPKLVLNRLCIALSAFIVHMLDDWPTAIVDVIHTFKNLNMPQITEEMRLWIMMEVLQAIPEEMQAVTTSVKRATLRGKIASHAGIVLETTKSYLDLQMQRENWDPETFSSMTRAVKCVDSWVKNIGICIENCQTLADLLLRIINRCYWPCHRDPDDGCMSADESDLAEICLKTLLAIIIQPDSHVYPKSAFLLIRMFLDSLCGITEKEWQRDNKNEDIVVNIYTLFVSAVERHSKLLLSGITASEPELAQLYGRLVNEVLQCTDKPGIYPVEESCSSMALSFWYMLQDEVFSLTDKDQYNKCWESIKPLYAHLTRILVRKAEQPDEHSIDKWSADDLESFRCYRQDISDIYMYCYEVLHESVLDILVSVLDETIEELQSNPTKWTKLESCIFGFQSVAEDFGGDEQKHIPKLLRVLNEIPYDKMNEKLLGTALETIAAYCRWLKENPAYIPGAIELLVRGLHSSMSAQATLGLKELCRDCQLQVKPYAEPLLNACQTALESGRMKNSDSVRLMYSIGKLMSVLQPESIPNYLDVIVGPCFEELQTMCQNRNKTAATCDRTIFRLNMVSTLFSSLNTDLDFEQGQSIESVQPVLLVMQKTMPIFRQTAELWMNEVEVIETACTALRHAISNLRASFRPMLQDLCFFIVAIFQTRYCAPILDLSKTAIVMFYNDESCKHLMQQLMIEFVIHSFKHFETIPENDFSNISEILETFYGCLMQIVKKIPQALADKSIACDKLIFYGLKAMTLPENGPIRSSVQFISHFVMQSRNYAEMTQVVHITGEEIIRTAIGCVGYATPRQQVEKFADIFLALNKKYPAELVTWLKIVMQAPNFPTNLVSDTEKSNFVTQIIREKVNKRLLQQHLNEFALKARGLSDKFE